MDLSSPEGHGINASSDADLCSLKYATVDDVVAAVKQIGLGVQLIKVNICSTYCIILVHQEDRWLFRIVWEGALI